MRHPGRTLSLLLMLGVTGCASVAAPSAAPSGALPPPLAMQEPIAGLPYDDARLEPVIAELRANPDWLDAPLGAEPTVLALVPSTTDLCLALRGPAGDVHVTIDPSTPWRVEAVAIDRGDVGREFTFDPEGLASDICPFVAFGRRDPWPPDAETIEVTGNIEAARARAVAEAVHASPERFGVDATGVPAVLVGDAVEPSADGWTCAQAVVFVGGPRAEVVLGTRPAALGWEVESRIVERAPMAPEPRSDGHC